MIETEISEERWRFRNKLCNVKSNKLLLRQYIGMHTDALCAIRRHGPNLVRLSVLCRQYYGGAENIPPIPSRFFSGIGITRKYLTLHSVIFTAT